MAGPEKRKGEQAPRDAAADERVGGGGEGAAREARPGERPSRAGEGDLGCRDDVDPREEEGYDQPESSAQKGTPRGR